MFILGNSQSKHNETNDLLAATCRELEEKRSVADALKKQSEKEDGKLRTEVGLVYFITFLLGTLC